jgi:hypothetical protein
MFALDENQAARIRAAYDDGGELSAAVELRRIFPGVDMEHARRCVTAIAGWQPLPPRPRPSAEVIPLRPGKRRSGG